MKRTGNYDERFEELEEPVEVDVKDGKAFIQFSGCKEVEAKDILKSSTIHGQIPEAVRVADLMGNGFQHLIKNSHE